MGHLLELTMTWEITLKERGERVDLGNLDICPVDPPGYTDFDDALMYTVQTLSIVYTEVGMTLLRSVLLILTSLYVGRS